MTSDSRGLGDWERLGRELRERSSAPIKNFAFVVFAFLSIGLLGCLGIWVEIVKIAISLKPVELAGLITAVLTFFPTLLGSACLQLILLSTSRNDIVFVSFSLLVLLAFIAVAILLSVFSETHPLTVLALGVPCSLCAVWVWWITNGDDRVFKSSPPPDAATGGSTDKRLPGDLNGFQT